MRIPVTVLLAWWLMVNTLALAPLPIPRPNPTWQWESRERFLHQEFCELNARRLRRDGLEAVCVYQDD